MPRRVRPGPKARVLPLVIRIKLGWLAKSTTAVPLGGAKMVNDFLFSCTAFVTLMSAKDT